MAINRGQMTAEEYAAVAGSLLTVQPRHALVFGCGRDSSLWRDLMPPEGFLCFVEDDPRWAKDVQAPVVLTTYTGTVAGWQDRDPLTCFDAHPLLAHVPWQWILVDAPRGDRPHAPGRLGPIRLASQFPRATVLVHDCHRPLEREACAKYLDRPYTQTHHLRVYDPQQE